MTVPVVEIPRIVDLVEEIVMAKEAQVLVPDLEMASEVHAARSVTPSVVS